MKSYEVIVNGIAYPCRPTIGAMLRFSQETGREVAEIKIDSPTDLCTYLWCYVVSGAKRGGKTFDMSLMDFADSISQEDMELWSKAVSADSPEACSDSDNEKKSLGALELLGIAVGCIGMSHDDFCKCNFDEFENIYNAWRDIYDGSVRESWEQTRTLTAICIQPHVKKKITPRQLWQFPWIKIKML